MNSMIKISVLLFLICLFIYVTSYLCLDNTTYQVMFLFISLILCIIKLSVRSVLSELKLLIPFIITMMFIYLILGLAGFKIGQDIKDGNVILFWIQYGANKTLLFISTVIFIQYILSFVRMSDIISLPLSISKKRYLLLGRALFTIAVKSISEIEFHLKLIPEFQKSRLTLKQWFRFKLQLTMALILMILRESEVRGNLIDNRVRHCFPKFKGDRR